MKLHFRFLCLGLLVLASQLQPGLVHAADHLDAPLVGTDGRLDINDVYIFRSPNDSSKVAMVMTVNPLAGVLSPTTFNTSARYEFNIDNDGDAQPDVVYQLAFGTPRPTDLSQRVTLRRNGALIGRGITGRNVRIRTAGGGLLRCGTFDDPFFFDLVGFQNGLAFEGNDFFEGLNTSAIVLEVPRSDLGGDAVGLYCRTVIGGTQFDRMGRPAINTVLIPSDAKDVFNETDPSDDPSVFGDTVRASVTALSGDADYAAAITDVLLPDLLTVDTSQSTAFLNGRQLADDVIDASLSLLTRGVVEGDGVDANDVEFPGVFPYLAPAHVIME
ncbi:MAG: DUF4331 family protein [Planctomycetota bacterium]